MTTPGIVIGLMVHRFRKLYFAFSAYVLLLVGLGQLPTPWINPVIAGLLCVPFGFGLLSTLFGFVNAEADIASSTSAYSPWLLRLPIRTWALVFWPTLAAATWATASWALFAAFYLRPRGILAPIWWPAAMFAALALNLQAIMWAPVRYGGVRLIFAIVMPMSIALFGQVAVLADWTAENIVEVYGLVALFSAAGAWVGIMRARTSPSSGVRRVAEVSNLSREVVIVHPKRPFTSPQSAQFWLEWRRQGRLLPLLTGFALFAMSLPLFFSKDMSYVQGSETIKANIWMTTGLPILPWIPLLFATAIGMGARRSDMRGQDGVYHLYHATRPLDAADLYKAKFRSIAAGVGITALMTMGTMLLWLWIPAVFNDGSSTPYAKIEFASFDTRAWVTLVGIAVVLTCWTLRNQLVGAFVDYMPSRKFASAYPFAVILIGTGMDVVIGENNQFLQEQKSVLVVGWILSAVLTAKIGIAIAFALKLRGLRPASSNELVKAFVGWAVTAAVFATAFGWIANDLKKGLPLCFQHPIPEMLAIALVPLARPIAARIALELGRHR